MKPSLYLSFVFISLFLFSCKRKNASDPSNETSFANSETAISESVQLWAEAFKNKDYNKAVNLFDTTANDIMLIGSDSSEVFSGKEQIRAFLKNILTQPFNLSWDIKKIDIAHNQNTAWTFVNATLIVADNGNVTKLPYRFVVVLTEKNNEWKWKLYHGSEPKPQ